MLPVPWTPTENKVAYDQRGNWQSTTVECGWAWPDRLEPTDCCWKTKYQLLICMWQWRIIMHCCTVWYWKICIYCAHLWQPQAAATITPQNYEQWLLCHKLTLFHELLPPYLHNATAAATLYVQYRRFTEHICTYHYVWEVSSLKPDKPDKKAFVQITCATPISIHSSDLSL